MSHYRELIKGNVINNNEDPYVEKYYIAKMQYLHTKILQSMQAKNQEMVSIPRNHVTQLLTCCRSLFLMQTSN